MSLKATGRALPLAAGVFWGAIVSLTITVVGASLVAYLVLAGRLSQQMIGYSSFIVVPFSVIAGGLVAIGRVKRRSLLVSMTVAGVYYFSLIGVALVFFGGVHHGTISTAVITFVTALAVGMAGSRNRGRGRFDGKKYRPS